jgi:hypothetical protein
MSDSMSDSLVTIIQYISLIYLTLNLVYVRFYVRFNVRFERDSKCPASGARPGLKAFFPRLFHGLKPVASTAVPPRGTFRHRSPFHWTLRAVAQGRL